MDIRAEGLSRSLQGVVTPGYRRGEREKDRKIERQKDKGPERDVEKQLITYKLIGAKRAESKSEQASTTVKF